MYVLMERRDKWNWSIKQQHIVCIRQMVTNDEKVQGLWVSYPLAIPPCRSLLYNMAPGKGFFTFEAHSSTTDEVML